MRHPFEAKALGWIGTPRRGTAKVAKAGSAYNLLTADLAKALHPHADVQIGRWVEGPDGKREVDVEVRGESGGEPFFALIECKDWKDKVGVEEVDKLDSKRKDLAADRTMIFSNSGFTEKALRKAKRVGIQPVSVLADGDDRVRVEVSVEAFARVFVITSWTLGLALEDHEVPRLPTAWTREDVMLDDRPVVNWLAERTEQRLLDDPRRIRGTLNVTASFILGTRLRVRDVSVEVAGLTSELTAESRWVSQIARYPNATIGYWDWIRSGVVVPSGASAYSPSYDMEGWEPVPDDVEVQQRKPAPDEIMIGVVLTKGIDRLEGHGVPDLDSRIDEIVIRWDDEDPEGVAPEGDSER